jgi:hypothetical protein
MTESTATSVRVEEKQQELPWYEQPGAKIRSAGDWWKVAEEDRPCLQQILVICNNPQGVIVEEIRRVFTLAAKLQRERFDPVTTDEMRKWRRYTLKTWRHILVNLFKYLKIADKEGLIERVAE